MEFRRIQLKTVPNAIKQMAEQFGGEDALLKAAINASFFLAPDRVLAAPFYPNYVRQSRELYPGKQRGDKVKVAGRILTLDFNHRAQATWEKVSGGFFQRGSGYGVRHIWGHASDLMAYTATWNLCYMPFWAGMLTEDQHPFKRLAIVIQQISFDLFFRNGPITSRDTPSFVVDRGLDLATELPPGTVCNLVPVDAS